MYAVTLSGPGEKEGDSPGLLLLVDTPCGPLYCRLGWHPVRHAPVPLLSKGWWGDSTPKGNPMQTSAYRLDSPAAITGLRLTISRYGACSSPDLDDLAASDAEWDADIAALPIKSDPTLLRRINPETVVLFVGRSTHEQPSSESLQLLESLNLLRTDERGDVEVIVDGEKIELQTER